jgi:hypothetical protein
MRPTQPRAAKYNASLLSLASAVGVDKASDNVLGTYVQNRTQYATLREIDSAYLTFLDNCLNPSDRIAPLFMLQAHASFRSAAWLAMSCQSAPAFMALRGCLESSLYGLYLDRNPDTLDTWLSRHDGQQARARVRAEFTINHLEK